MWGFSYHFAPVPAAGPLAWPKYPGGGIGGMTRLKGMGMFMAVTWLGPALIIPIWSWVWKYMLDGRPGEEKPQRSQTSWIFKNQFIFLLLAVMGGLVNGINRSQKLKGRCYHCQEPPIFLVQFIPRLKISEIHLTGSFPLSYCFAAPSKIPETLTHTLSLFPSFFTCSAYIKLDHSGFNTKSKIQIHQEHFQFLNSIFFL